MKTARFFLLLLLMLLAACSSLVQKNGSRPEAALLERALTGELILGHAYTPAELPTADLFGLTPEMRDFVARAIEDKRSPDAKAEAIHRALMGPVSDGGLGISYSAQTTNTGIEAFRARQANCLSYTLLYVAMAKHAGLNAYFNEVILPPTWDMRGEDTYLFMRHMNARVVMPKFMHTLTRIADVGRAQQDDIVVDLEMRRYRPTYRQHKLNNDQAASQYYSNRGMELAAGGDTKSAFLHLRKALRLVDNESYIWSNMGSLYRRLGFLAEAEALYLHGLTIDARDYTIMHNLTGLYRQLGNKEQEALFRARVRKHRAANPYYQYRLAQDWMQESNYEKARESIEKALQQEKKEPRFYRLAVEIYEHLNEIKKARDARAKLDKLYETVTDQVPSGLR
jgi:tetratricopeptide (TPR) repeat protein